MLNVTIPYIGESGVYVLKPPFNTKTGAKERYTCQSVRTITDMLASNEDAYKDIYEPAGLTQDEYEEDQKQNIPVISLQGAVGQWVSVPARYIEKCPDQNGVKYRAVSINIALPPFKESTDFTAAITSLKNTITDSLGVDCKIKVVTTTKTVQIDDVKSTKLEVDRLLVKGAGGTDRSRYISKCRENDLLRQQIAELEAMLLQYAP